MLATDYPILVKDFSGEQAMTIVCQECHTEEVIGPDDLLNEGLYMCPRDEYGKPTACGGTAVMKYELADECKGCGKLGFWESVLGGCCSRVCQLQAEYAAELRDRKGATA